MVNLGLRRNSVLKDGKKAGSFYFPPNLFQLRLGDRRIRIIHTNSGGLSILLKNGGTLRYTPVAKMEGAILEYKGENYRVAYDYVEGKIRPCVLLEEKNKMVAFSNLDGSMEYSESEEPVLEAVGILFLCIIKFAGTNLPDFGTYLAVLNKEFYGRFGKLSAVYPAILIFAGLGTIVLSRFHSTGVWALVVLAGFSFVLIGSYLFLIFEYFRKRITVTETMRSSN